MAVEIEYRYLLKNNFAKKEFEKKRIKAVQQIQQGYLSRKLNVRVRIIMEGSKERAFLTYKRGKGVIRDEYECEIDLEVGKELVKDAIILVEKTRYKYKYDNYIWDIDYYPLRDIWTAEIELSKIDESYKKLPFIDRDITGLKDYSNKSLGIKDYLENE